MAGEIDDETFNADAARPRGSGPASPRTIGWAKDVVVNALRLAARWVAALPAERSPRAHHRPPPASSIPSRSLAPPKKPPCASSCATSSSPASPPTTRSSEKITADLRTAEPRARFALTFNAQYRNLRYRPSTRTAPSPTPAKPSAAPGLTPVSNPIRGGTDGIKSEPPAIGLPTPQPLRRHAREVHTAPRMGQPPRHDQVSRNPHSPPRTGVGAENADILTHSTIRTIALRSEQVIRTVKTSPTIG